MALTIMPPRLANMYALALALNLPNPLGRAVYATNRRYNGGFQRRTDEQIMRATKESTAQRWAEHWENGGTLKSLSPAYRRKGFVPVPSPPEEPRQRRAISLTEDI